MTETASAAVSHQRLRRRKWDVFLNFQRNTSHSFIDRLYEVLTKEQVRVWKDDAERSNHELVEEAMEDSVAFVVVLSPEYAKSHMCLEELAKLCDMKSSLGHFILPIFYNVEPWHFRRHSPFENDFEEHSKRFGEEEIHDKRDFTLVISNALL